VVSDETAHTSTKQAFAGTTQWPLPSTKATIISNGKPTLPPSRKSLADYNAINISSDVDAPSGVCATLTRHQVVPDAIQLKRG
jgi:hypothetical protein